MTSHLSSRALSRVVVRAFGSRLAWTGVALIALLPACNKGSGQEEKPAGMAPSPAAAPTAPTPAPAPARTPAPAENEADTVPAAPDPKTSISGTITLPKARKKDVAKGDVLFVIARKAGGAGPGSLLAVQKQTVSDFPMPFLLSSRDAMIPGTTFEGAIDITVRVDKDGDPITRKKGDVLGEAKGVKVGSTSVAIPLDTVLTADVTLGGPHGPMGGSLPPGHP